MTQAQAYATREEAMAVSCNAYQLDAMCGACGKRWANHCGADCLTPHFSTFRLAVEQPKPTEIDPLFSSAHYMDGRDLKQAERKEETASEYDAEDMRRRDAAAWAEWDALNTAEPKQEPQWVIDARIRVQQKRAADQTYERKRPALDWNKSTPFDNFEGFTTRYDTGAQIEGPTHPLQRVSDSADPMHGSAFLKIR